jgi:hypothetical protein
VKHCCAAPRRACEAATALRTSNTLGEMRFQMGIAAGKCHVGNVGTASTKTFSVVGPAFTHAVMLERLSRLYGAGCRALITARVCQDVSTQFRFRFVDHVMLPPHQPTLIAALQEALASTDEARGVSGQRPAVAGGGDAEWLYVLQAQIAGDANTTHNAAFQRLASNAKDAHDIPEQQGQGISSGAPSPTAAAQKNVTAAVPDDEDVAKKSSDDIEDRLSELRARWHEVGATSRHGPTTDLGAFHTAFVRPPRHREA